MEREQRIGLGPVVTMERLTEAIEELQGARVPDRAIITPTRRKRAEGAWDWFLVARWDDMPLMRGVSLGGVPRDVEPVEVPDDSPANE